MSEMMKVGIADLKTCKAPDGVMTLGLGSCVGAFLLTTYASANLPFAVYCHQESCHQDRRSGTYYAAGQ